MLTLYSGRRVPISFRTPWVAVPGRRVALRFGPQEPGPPDPPAPEIVGDLSTTAWARWGGLHPQLAAVASGASQFVALRSTRMPDWGGLGSHSAKTMLVWGGLQAQRAAQVAAWMPSRALVRAALQSPWASKPTISNAPAVCWSITRPWLERGAWHRWTVPPSHARRAHILWLSLIHI